MMYQERHSLDGKLACLCNVVARNHPSGHEAILGRFRIERVAAGQDATALTAMLERWTALEDEAQVEADRQARALFERNLQLQLEEQRRASVAQWRERQPLHSILAALRDAIDEAGRMVGVETDSDLLNHLDRVTSALKSADLAIGAERREARMRVSAAQAAAAVESFAPVADDAEAA